MSEPVFEVFFDGACPLCTREIRAVRRLDRKGRVRYTDISAPDFDAATIGRTQAQVMAEIHGRLPDGTLVTGVEVMRRLWDAAGLGFLVGPTRLPGISHALDAAYAVFARNRLRITGRPCEDGACVPVARKA